MPQFFYLINQIFAVETVQGRKLFKGRNYGRKSGISHVLTYGNYVNAFLKFKTLQMLFISIIQKILTKIIRMILKVKNNVILYIIITMKMKKEHVCRGGN